MNGRPEDKQVTEQWERDKARPAIRLSAFGCPVDFGVMALSGRTRYVQIPSVEFGMLTFERHWLDSGGIEYRLIHVARPGRPPAL